MKKLETIVGGIILGLLMLPAVIYEGCKAMIKRDESQYLITKPKDQQNYRGLL